MQSIKGSQVLARKHVGNFCPSPASPRVLVATLAAQLQRFPDVSHLSQASTPAASAPASDAHQLLLWHAPSALQQQNGQHPPCPCTWLASTRAKITSPAARYLHAGDQAAKWECRMLQKSTASSAAASSSLVLSSSALFLAAASTASILSSARAARCACLSRSAKEKT